MPRVSESCSDGESGSVNVPEGANVSEDVMANLVDKFGKLNCLLHRAQRNEASYPTRRQQHHHLLPTVLQTVRCWTLLLLPLLHSSPLLRQILIKITFPNHHWQQPHPWRWCMEKAISCSLLADRCTQGSISALWECHIFGCPKER